MSKYSNLTIEERALLLKLADAYKNRNTTIWTLVKRFGPPPAPGIDPVELKDGAELSPFNGQANVITAVPGSDSFYIGLKKKGFLSLATNSRGSLQLSVQQPTLDYSDYVAKNPLGQRWEDLYYYLGQEATGSRLFWLLLGVVLSGVLAAVLRLLGLV